MSLFAWSSALAALGYSAFALRLLQQGYGLALHDGPRVGVLVAVLLSAVWGWADLVWRLQPTSAARWLGSLADLGRYGAWLALMWLLLRANRAGKASAELGWLAPISALLVLLNLLALLLVFAQQRSLGEPALLLLWAQLGLPVLALVALEQVFRNTDRDARWGIKPLCLGLCSLFVFDLYLFAQAVLFAHADADALAIRGMVHAAVLPLLAQSVVQRGDWLARVRISPRAAFHSAALLGVGLYLLFLSGVGYYVRYFGGAWGRALQEGLVFVGLVGLLLLLFSGSARAKLRVLLGKHLFHYRFDYREEWLRFTRTLSERESPQEVGQQIIRGLADMLESTGGALWTQAHSGAAFSQSAHWNLAPSLQHEAPDSPLCRFLAGTGWVIDLQQYRAQPGHYGHLALPAWLQESTQAWLVIPLLVDQGLIGFCVLARARTRIDVNWEVNDLLKTAGRQAASYLAQAQATEALLEARKFEAFNRMSAFVAHDLKNIVTQLALLLRNAKRLGDNPAFQKDMLMTIENALERMRRTLLQLRQDDAQPLGPGMGVDLVALLQRIAEDCQRLRSTGLELHCSEPLQVRAHGERLQRVLGHIVHNALDATESGGRVWVDLQRCGEQARVRVGDTGHGMSAQFVQNRLFKPFQSTKPAGMGIGAFESLQYVQELGGSIQVESTEGQGTLVTLQLPLLEAPVAVSAQAARYA